MDYLRKYARDLNIKIIYTKNKYTVLSVGFSKEKPVIRAHELFRDCPNYIATAIIDYYIQYVNSHNNLDTIREYVRQHFGLDKFVIKSKSELFNRLLSKTDNYHRNRFVWQKKAKT